MQWLLRTGIRVYKIAGVDRGWADVHKNLPEAANGWIRVILILLLGGKCGLRIHICCQDYPKKKVIDIAEIESICLVDVAVLLDKNSSIAVASQCGAVGSLVWGSKVSVHVDGILFARSTSLNTLESLRTTSQNRQNIRKVDKKICISNYPCNRLHPWTKYPTQRV